MSLELELAAMRVNSRNPAEVIRMDELGLKEGHTSLPDVCI